MFPDINSVFDAAGAMSWGAVIAVVIEFLKRWDLSPVPSQGRGVLISVALAAAGVVGLAIWSIGAPTEVTAQYVIDTIVTWAAVISAAIGSYEVTAKAARVVQGTTDPNAKDR